jgi:hypothetical protein
MPELLRPTDSTSTCLSVVLRHQRLCRQLDLAAYADAIEPRASALRAASDALHTAESQADHAKDLAELTRTALLNSIRNAHDLCRRLDREDPRSRVQTLVFFPDGKLTDVTRPRPASGLGQSAAQLLDRISSLGPDHPAAAVLPELRSRLAAFQVATEAHAMARLSARSANDRMLRARSELCQAFEASYFRAAGELGKPGAEQLFPRFRSRRSRSRAEPSNGQGAAAPGAGSNVTVSVQLHEAAAASHEPPGLASGPALSLPAAPA